jgi:hypothetical protein
VSRKVSCSLLLLALITVPAILPAQQSPGNDQAAGRAARSIATVSSDPFAVALAQRSVSALTGGVPVFDVTINANVIST